MSVRLSNIVPASNFRLNNFIYNRIQEELRFLSRVFADRFPDSFCPSTPYFPFISLLQMLLDSPLMRLDAFDYHLPPEQIAQRPLERRDASRLLELHRAGGSPSDHLFVDLPNLLRGDELIVLNNTRVIPARLFG